MIPQSITKEGAFRMKHRYSAFLATIGFAALLCGPMQTPAQSLGSAANFAALAGTTVTNTGPSVLTGNLGVSPGSAITGFPPGTITGTAHANDGVAVQAQNDLTTAYNYFAGLSTYTVLTGDLGGRTLTPGVYRYTSSAQLTGTLTLDGAGTYVFQIGSTLTTATGASVVLTNGASACDVWWQIGSSATLGASTFLQGNILALTSITLVSGANVSGRTLARNGAVTLDDNDVTICAGPPSSIPTLSEWGIITLMVLLVLSGALAIRRQRKLPRIA
jgi:hypothetical protein